MITAACGSLNSEATLASADQKLVSSPAPTTLSMPVATLGQESAQARLEGSAVTAALEQINQYNQQEQYGQSLALTQQLLKQYPNNPDLALMEGVLFNQLNRTDEAERVFQRLSEKHPELPEPLNNLAVIYVNRGDLNRAISTLQRAFETHPSYARVQSNLRTLYTTLASQAYNRALNLGSQAPAPVLTSLDRIPEQTRTLAGHSGEQLVANPLATGQTARLILASNQGNGNQGIGSPSSEPLSAAEKAEVQADIIRGAQRVVAAPSAVDTATVTASQPGVEAAESKATETLATPSVTPTNVVAEQVIAAKATVEKTVVKNIVETSTTQPSAATVTTAPVAVASASANAIPAPAPVQETVAQPEISPREVLKQQVSDWAAAWSAQDVPAYLSFYTPDFRPASRLSNKRWKQLRQQRLTRPKSISVDVSGISIQMKAPDHANVNFTQRYRADSYRDKVIKTLTFRKLDSGWKISAELSRKAR